MEHMEWINGAELSDITGHLNVKQQIKRPKLGQDDMLYLVAFNQLTHVLPPCAVTLSFTNCTANEECFILLNLLAAVNKSRR